MNIIKMNIFPQIRFTQLTSTLTRFVLNEETTERFENAAVLKETGVVWESQLSRGITGP